MEPIGKEEFFEKAKAAVDNWKEGYWSDWTALMAIHDLLYPPAINVDGSKIITKDRKEDLGEDQIPNRKSRMRKLCAIIIALGGAIGIFILDAIVRQGRMP